jgi:hypothetical protein
MSAYAGRLAFDPETNFHVDPDGNRVVTDDAGATWRYATDADASHVERYQTSVANVDSTANDVARFLIEGGTEADAQEKWPHHYGVQPDDPHFDGLVFNPDATAPDASSSTQASQASIDDGTQEST